MAEAYKAEQAQISGVEKEAAQKKHEELKQTLASKHDVFFSQASEAGRLISQAETAVSDAKGKEQIKKDKEAIRSHLGQVAEKGRTILAAEKGDKPHPELTSISTLAGSISGFVEKAKTEMPIYMAIEKARGLHQKAQPDVTKVLKFKNPKEREGLKPGEIRVELNIALDLLATAEDGIDNLLPENFPSEAPRQMLKEVQSAIDSQEAELAAIGLAVREGAEKENPELDKLDAANQAYDKSKESTDYVFDLNEKIQGDKTMSGATFKDTVSRMYGSARASFDELAKVNQQLKQIKDPTGMAPQYQALYQQLLINANRDLNAIQDVKLYCATHDLVGSGEMNKYFIFKPDGTVEETTDFKGLDVWKQQELLKKLHSLPIEIQLELDEKMATPEEKNLIEGKKKMAGGDWVGAKTDLLKYYNETAGKEGLDQSRIGETKELLKQIAKLEIAQCAGRIQAMRDSISGRYEWRIEPGAKTDYGVHTKDEAELYLEDMSHLLVMAEQMIENGEVLTIGDAELKLHQMKGSLTTSYQHYRDKLIELKRKDPNDESLKKEREESIKRKKGFLETQKQALERAMRGEPAPLSGDLPTPELVERMRERYEKMKAEAEALEQMTPEQYKAYMVANTQRAVNDERAKSALVRFNSGFNGAADVFDVFRQQRILNNPDQTKREEGILQLAKTARDRGLPALARVYYDMYFAKELEQQSRLITKAEVLKKFLEDDDNTEHISDQVENWSENFQEKVGRPPTEEELDNARGQMVSFMVDDAYSRELKKRVHVNFEGMDTERAKAWKDAYGGAVAVEDIGQEGMFEGLWTDESWNALPAKVAIMASIIVVSATTAGAAVGALAPSSAAIALLGEGAVGRIVGFGADLAVESLVFVSTEGVLNGAIQGDWSTFSSGGAFLSSWGHNALTLGVLKGVGGGIGKIRQVKGQAAFEKMAEGEAARMAYMPKSLGGYADDAAWWTTRTATEATALTGMAWTEAKLGGREFGARDAFRSFGDNVVFAIAIGAVHRAGDIGMEHGATGKERKATEKRRSKNERDLIEKIDKSSRLDVQVEAARKKAATAKETGAPDAPKLEAEAKRAEVKAREAELTVRRAEAENRATELAEVQKTIDAMRKRLERTDLPAEERGRLQQLVEHFERAKTGGEELAKAEKALFEEHRVIEVPDPANPGKTKRIDLFEHYNSKNFAYSKEMADLMNNHERLLKEGPKIIKHGGDEFVILHAGPDGKVQMFFGDVGNMGPTNEFALRVKGQDANMVDLYLHEFSQIVRERFQPGKDVDGPALLNEIKNNLSKKYFGIETKAEFDALAKQWGLQGTWEQYQTNMGNARILAGFRGSSRGLQKEFAEMYGDRSSDPAQINRDFAEFIDKKIQGLDSGSPPLTDILRQNLNAMKEKGALADLFPKGSEFNDVGRMNPATLEKILSKSTTERTAEENMMIYFALQRVDTAKIETLSGMDAAGTQAIRDRFGKLRQPADMSTLMDFQMSGINVPRFEGREFNTADMKFFLDHVLEHGLHEAKKQKNKADIYRSENPFDAYGEIRADHPDAVKMKEAHERAKGDEKANVIAETQKSIREAEKKLDDLLNQMRSLRERETLTEADEKRLADMIRESDELIQKINANKYKDAETGADRPGKYNQDIAFWMRGRDGKPIEKEYQMYREFVIDMHNTGAINGQKGYATTDAAMRTIADFMMARFPGATSIIRTGGGSFKLVFMDSRQLPRPDGKPMALVEHQAMIEAALPELNVAVQKVIAPDANTVVDGSVRDATESFRKRGGVPSPVGQVDIVTARHMNANEFGKARDSKKSPVTLYNIVEGRNVPYPVTPAQGPLLPAVPKAKPKSVPKAA